MVAKEWLCTENPDIAIATIYGNLNTKGYATLQQDGSQMCHTLTHVAALDRTQKQKVQARRCDHVM